MDSKVREYLAEIGSKGGKAKVKKGLGTLSAEERSEIARQGAEAMWAKRRAAAKKSAKKTTKASK